MNENTPIAIHKSTPDQISTKRKKDARNVFFSFVDVTQFHL